MEEPDWFIIYTITSCAPNNNLNIKLLPRLKQQMRGKYTKVLAVLQEI